MSRAKTALTILMVCLLTHQAAWAASENLKVRKGWYKGFFSLQSPSEPFIMGNFDRPYTDTYLNYIYDFRKTEVRVSAKESRIALVERSSGSRFLIDFKKATEQEMPRSFIDVLKGSSLFGMYARLVDRATVSEIEEIAQIDKNRIKYKGVLNVYASLEVSKSLVIRGLFRMPIYIESFPLGPDPEQYYGENAAIVTAEDLEGLHGLKVIWHFEPTSVELNIGNRESNRLLSEIVEFVFRSAFKGSNLAVVLMPNLDGIK